MLENIINSKDQLIANLENQVQVTQTSLIEWGIMYNANAQMVLDAQWWINYLEDKGNRYLTKYID